MAEYDLVYDGRYVFSRDPHSGEQGPTSDKVEVVKGIRLLTGCGLKQAKEHAEALLANPHKSYRITVDSYNEKICYSQMTVNQVLGTLRKYGVCVYRINDRQDDHNQRLKLDDEIEDLAVKAINERAYDRARQLLAILESDS